MSDDPRELLVFAEQLADAARAVTLASFRRPLEIIKKEDSSPVTAVDRASEKTMRALIEKHRPADGIFGEEFGHVAGSNEYVWVLDPIDGTNSFISGSQLYCTLISLVRGGVPLLGVIDTPALNDRWLGLTNAADATQNLVDFNGAVCKTSAAESLSSAVMATTTISLQDNEDDVKLRRLRSKVAHTRMGGDASCYGCLASGFVDIAVDYMMRPYDYLPLVPIVTAAGGVISDWQGAPLTLSENTDCITVIAAATPALHKKALAVFAE